jgi:hypothetical protein
MRIVQGAIVSIKEGAGVASIGNSSTMQQGRQGEVQMLRYQQVGKQLQQFGIRLEFTVGGGVQGGDRT